MRDVWQSVNQNISGILEAYKKVAVVGLSPNMHRPSHSVAAYLIDAGYEIIPVNPGHSEIMGLTCYPFLGEIPEPIEIVDIFRRSKDVLPVVQAAIEIGAKVVWMQSGIVNEQAAALALDAGLEVVMDACMKIEHSYLR